jgi:hypothetical protein
VKEPYERLESEEEKKGCRSKIFLPVLFHTWKRDITKKEWKILPKK